MLAGTSTAMLVGTYWKKILSAFPLPSALLGIENFFLCMFFRAQEGFHVPVGLKKDFHTRGFSCSGGTEKGFSCSGGTEKKDFHVPVGLKKDFHVPVGLKKGGYELLRFGEKPVK